MKQDFKPTGYPNYKYMVYYSDKLLHIGFKQK